MYIQIFRLIYFVFVLLLFIIYIILPCLIRKYTNMFVIYYAYCFPVPRNGEGSMKLLRLRKSQNLTMVKAYPSRVSRQPWSCCQCNQNQPKLPKRLCKSNTNFGIHSRCLKWVYFIRRLIFKSKLNAFVLLQMKKSRVMSRSKLTSSCQT